VPLGGSVGAACADVSDNGVRWRINEGKERKKRMRARQMHLVSRLSEDDCHPLALWKELLCFSSLTPASGESGRSLALSSDWEWVWE